MDTDGSLYSITYKTTAYKRSFIHRMVYVATKCSRQTAGDNMSFIAEYYEQFISKFQKNPQMEGVSGMLLLYPNCLIHLLECSSVVLVEILKDLSEMETRTDSFLKDVRILVISYCIPTRMFRTWMYRSFNLPSSLLDEECETQPFELLVTECLSTLYKLCTQLMSRLKQSILEKECPPVERDVCPLQEESEQVMLVEEQTVMYLCHSTSLPSPSILLQAHTKPFNILMDSEVMWPTQHRLYW